MHKCKEEVRSWLKHWGFWSAVVPKYQGFHGSVWFLSQRTSGLGTASGWTDGAVLACPNIWMTTALGQLMRSRPASGRCHLKILIPDEGLLFYSISCKLFAFTSLAEGSGGESGRWHKAMGSWCRCWRAAFLWFVTWRTLILMLGFTDSCLVQALLFKR